MSDQFLRLVSRSTKFEKQGTTKHLDFFSPQKSSTSNSAPLTPANTAAALDFFGSNTPAPIPTQTTNGNGKHGTKRGRDEDEDEEEAVMKEEEESEEEMVDDGENDLEEDEDDEREEGEEEEGEGVQLFNRSRESTIPDTDDTNDASGTPAASAVKRIKEFRRNAGIHVQGSDIPPPFEHFNDLRHARYKVADYMIANLQRSIKEEGCGYSNPTPIQQQAIPILLKGRELLACAPTGSGKTAAFVVPILAALKRPEKVGFRALILAPTRELAEQTHRCFNTISKGRKFKIFHLSKANANSNTFGANSNTKRDILITTPMRLVHLIENDAIDLSHVEFLILDEADRLFELGFLDQVDTVMNACTHPQLKRALFSATMMQGVEQLARTVLRDPIHLTIGAKNSATTSIKQELLFVGTEEGKLLAFRQMISSGLDIPVLIFVQSKERAQQLYNELVYEPINLDVIHAERTQHQREESIKKFRNGQVWVLICTDLMARGIDFKGVNTVINYDFPQSTVSYIHRIGRTGRAGRQGHAVTFFTETDKPLLHSIAKIVAQSGCQVPEWMLKMNKIGTKKAKRLKDNAPPRQAIVPNSKSSAANKKARDRKKKRKLGNNSESATPTSTKSDVSSTTTKSKKKTVHNE